MQYALSRTGLEEKQPQLQKRYPPEASGGGSEVRGSSTSKGSRNLKRAKKVLERWPPGPKEGRGEGRNKPQGKKKTLKQQEEFTDIREWFEKG